jgi:hypothetical protein
VGEYVLTRPVKFGGDVVTKLVYREETEVDDLIAVDEAKGDLAKMKALIASLCGISPQVVGRMSPADFTAMTERVAPFLGDGLPTGEAPSTTSSPPSTGGLPKSGGSRRLSSASGSHAPRR